MAASDFDEFFRAHFDTVASALTASDGHRVNWLPTPAQDTFTKAYERWRRVKQMDRPDGWVYVVAMNAVRRRQVRRERKTPVPEAAPASDAIGSVTTLALRKREAIATLPPRQREAVVLRYLADLTIADVAEAMDCAVGTGESHAAPSAEITARRVRGD